MPIKVVCFVSMIALLMHGCTGSSEKDEVSGPSGAKQKSSDQGKGAGNKESNPPARIDPTAQLNTYLLIERAERSPLADQPFADLSLTREQAAAARALFWQDHVKRIRSERAAEMKAKVLIDGDFKMPFFYKTFGEKPETGRSLYISMHGGGGGPAAMNDQQWQNQMRLYQPTEGVYVAPRAPTNTWNLWHQAHIDKLFDRLIENMIVFEEVNPNKVYIMGYSAGGDGVYQLAPRMADRWAAASMMAGHPNETSPLGLRNLPFSLHVGERDAAYKRNIIAKQWQQKLTDLQKQDPGGYEHWVKVYEGKGHWMDREDAAALPWMANYTRYPFPTRIVWKQDDVTHDRFYWLAVGMDEDKGNPLPRSEVFATRDGQTIEVQSNEVKHIAIRLNDQMLNLDEPIKITSQGKTLFEGKINRRIKTIEKTLAERGDPTAVFSGEVAVELPIVRSTD